MSDSRSLYRKRSHGATTSARLAWATACVLHGVALAQDATGPADQSTGVTGNSPGLEEVTVTARRREESLQQVPVAVTALSPEDLERKGITDAQSLELAAPSFTLDMLGSGRVRTAIRGLGSDNTSPGQEFSTSMFLDGVPMGTGGMAAVDIFDVERVEVLKGPQGTLYGKNVVGGVVNVIPAHAKLRTFESQLSATVGNYGQTDGEGYINFATGDAVAHRFAFSVLHHDGYVENRSGAGDPDDQDHQGVRYSLTAEPGDSVSLNLALDYAHDDGNGRGGYVAGNRPFNADGSRVTSARSFTALDLHAVDDPWSVNLDDPGYVSRNMRGARLGLTWSLGADIDFDFVGSYRSISDGYFHNDTGWEIDDPELQRIADRTIVPGAAQPGGIGYQLGFGLRDDADQYTLEGRLSQEAGAWHWTAGVFYSDLDYQQKIDFVLNSFNCEGARSLALGTCTTSIANDAADVSSLTKDVGVFGEATYDFTESLSFTAGVRYSKTDKDFLWNNNLARRTGSAFSGPVLAAPFTDSRSWDDVTYKGTLDYKINDDVMVYASYATGFKPGGYGGITDSRTLAATSEETVKASELGFKSTLGMARLNVALFDMSLEGLQVTQVQAGSTSAAFFASVDTVEVRGAEVELVLRPVRDLSLTTQYTYLDATLRGYPTAPDRTFVLQRAPKHDVSFDASYTLPVAVFSGDIELGASYSYRDKVFDDPDDSSGEIRPARTLVDAYVLWSDGLTSVRFWGRNLGDELYYNRMTDSADGSYANLGAPRTYGATFTRSFR